jgi:hypothetical protein
MLKQFIDLFRPNTAPHAVEITSRTAKNNRKVPHIFAFLQPKGTRHFHGDSVWKEYKTFHAPRHVANRLRR